MKLNREGINARSAWTGYKLPDFDIDNMVKRTRANPVWLHLGAGNIFRAFPAAMQQELLEKGLTDRGITVCECYDEAIIPSCYVPYDNLSLLVTLKADGGMEKRVIASIAEAFNCVTAGSCGGSPIDSQDLILQDAKARLAAVLAAPSLQMVTFTITEKGYAITDALKRDAKSHPDRAETVIGRITAGLYGRYRAGAYPVALLSLDNCAGNGTRLAEAVWFIAEAWQSRGVTVPGFVDYLRSGHVSFPWSMIDKITPRPSETVAAFLRGEGYADTAIIETAKHTFLASFVNAEVCQYLVVEDDFPNGRPPFEAAGMLLAARETVQKAERMKVGTCLNPLHTILAIAGMLLNYQSIAACMRDRRLVALIRRAAYDESLPVVAHPGVINPAQFLEEVLTERLPNPFIPDTPARIACDTSQKIPVRFGETLKARLEAGLSLEDLEAIPFFFALWLRYLMAVDDEGQVMTLSPDPCLPELTARLAGITWGGEDSSQGTFVQEISIQEILHPILSDCHLFGVSLYDEHIRLGAKTEMYFKSLITGCGAVSQALTQFTQIEFNS